MFGVEPNADGFEWLGVDEVPITTVCCASCVMPPGATSSPVTVVEASHPLPRDMGLIRGGRVEHHRFRGFVCDPASTPDLSRCTPRGRIFPIVAGLRHMMAKRVAG